MRSVSVSSRGVSRVIRFSGLVSVAAMLGACSVNSDRLSSFTNSTADTSQPIVDPLSPQATSRLCRVILQSVCVSSS